MSARKYEMYLALETMIVEVSSQIAISRNVQLGRQWNHIHRLDAYSSLTFAYSWSSLTFRPFLMLNSGLNLTNFFDPNLAVANLLKDLLNLILAFFDL